jgi:peptide/nickel transport system permease protein
MLSILLVTLVVFLLTHATGNAAAMNVSATAGQSEVDAMAERLGLDRPLPEQFATYVGQLLRGDLGESIRFRTGVWDLIASRIAASLQLAGMAAVMAILFAGVLGLLVPLSGSRRLRSFVNAFSVAGISLPAFWVGLVSVQLLALRWNLFPVAGSGGVNHMVLPAFAMSLFLAGGMARLFVAGIDDVLASPYILAANARGMTRTHIVFKHVVRNASLPVVAYFGTYLPLLISSAVVVETVFSWPGLGRLAYEAVVARDFPVIQGVTLIGAVIVVVTNILTDLLSAVLDPRIRDGAVV